MRDLSEACAFDQPYALPKMYYKVYYSISAAIHLRLMKNTESDKYLVIKKKAESSVVTNTSKTDEHPESAVTKVTKTIKSSTTTNKTSKDKETKPVNKEDEPKEDSSESSQKCKTRKVVSKE